MARHVGSNFKFLVRKMEVTLYFLFNILVYFCSHIIRSFAGYLFSFNLHVSKREKTENANVIGDWA